MVVKKVSPIDYRLYSLYPFRDSEIENIKPLPASKYKTRTMKARHPADMIPYDRAKSHQENWRDAGQKLQKLIAQWRAEALPETQAAWAKEKAERDAANERFSRQLAPLFGFTRKAAARR